MFPSLSTYFLEDAPLRYFVASHIPGFIESAKNKKERQKMATSRDVDRHFRSLGSRNPDVRVKHLVMQPGNAPKDRPSHLTTSDEVNKSVSLKDSPSKTTKAESFRGRRP